MTAAPSARPPESPQEKALPEWRCRRCHRLLARLLLLPGCRGEIKCERCGTVNTVGDDLQPRTCAA